METVILVLHYLVCIFLIVVILLQAGKGADIGAAFGGGSQTVFGTRGAATFLSKMTTVVAIVFLITSTSLASISRNKSKSSILKSVTDTGQPVTIPIGTPAPSPSPKAETALQAATSPEGNASPPPSPQAADKAKKSR